MKKILALFLACISFTCFSCGQDTPADDVAENTVETSAEETTAESVTESETEQNEVSAFVGKWQGVKIIENGEESDKFENMPIWAVFQFELCEDGSIKFGETTSGLIDPDVTWSWRRMSSSIEIELYSDDDDDDVSVLTLDGDYLIFEESDDVLYLEKVEEFTPYQYEEETTENVTHEYIDADPTAFIGKWESVKLTTNKKKQYLMSLPLEEICRLEVYDDHTVVISGVEIIGVEKFMCGTWGMVSENEIEILTDNGESILFKLDDNSLVCKNEDITVSLARVEEFSEIKFDTANLLFAGKWQSQKAIQNGNELDNAYGVPVCNAYQFKLNEDGSAVINGVLGGKWSYSEGAVEIVLNTGSVMLWYPKDEYLVNADGEIEFYLERVDEFAPYELEEKTSVTTESNLLPETVTGKWQGIYIIDENNQKITDDIVSMLYQFEFNEDGTLSFGEILADYHEGDDVYKWEISGNDINLYNSDDEKIVFSYKGIEHHTEELNCHEYKYCLIYDYYGKEVCLEKVSEFMPIDSEILMEITGIDDIISAKENEVSGTTSTDTINE